jgi:hypothetical protein
MPVDRNTYTFFREHAGWIVGENARCALHLARAEALLEQAVELELAEIVWEPEDYWAWGDLGDVSTREEMEAKFDSNEWTGPFFARIVLKPNESTRFTATGRGMIVLGPRELGDPYARVIAAEMAWEIEDDLRQAIGDELDSRMEVMPMANA